MRLPAGQASAEPLQGTLHYVEYIVVRSKYSYSFPMVETEQPAKPFTGAHLALGLR